MRCAGQRSSDAAAMLPFPKAGGGREVDLRWMIERKSARGLGSVRESKGGTVTTRTSQINAFHEDSHNA